MVTSGVGAEAVAGAADGEDEGGVGLHLAARSADVDLEQPGVAEVVVAPDAVQELLAGDDPAARRGRVRQIASRTRGPPVPSPGRPRLSDSSAWHEPGGRHPRP